MNYPRSGRAAASSRSGSRASGFVRILLTSLFLPFVSLAQIADWQSADVGFVGIAGRAETFGSAITLHGSGADIWDTADGFRFHYRSLSGDAQITARVSQVFGQHEWCKAGLMVRESLAPGAANALIFMPVSSTLVLQSRAAGGASTALIAGPSYAAWQRGSAWLRLIRSGDTVTGYISLDGADWQELGRTTVALSSTVLVGLAVTSHDNTALASATFDNIAIGGAVPPAAPTQLFTGATGSTSLGMRWNDNSFDETRFEVEQSVDGTNFRVRAIEAANFSFQDNALNPDTPYYYRVRAFRGSSASAYSNVTLSRTLAAQRLVAWSDQTIDAGLAGGTTDSGGVLSVRGAGIGAVGANDFLHTRFRTLEGDGEIVARLTSVENTGAGAIAGVALRTGLDGRAANILLAVDPQFSARLQYRSAFGADTITLATQPRTGPLWIKLTRRGSALTGSVSSDGSTWTDLGATTIPVPTLLYAGLVVASGRDDALCMATFDNYAIRDLSTPATPPPTPGNFAATATSSSEIALSWSDVATETSYEVESSNDNVTFTHVTTTAANATTFLHSGRNASTTYFYRMRARNDAGASNYSNVVSATAPAGPVTPPPSAWTAQDVGAVSVAGSTSESGGTITLRGSGADIWDTSDEFHYRHQTLTGDGTITARVTGLTDTHGWAKAGLMFREALTGPSRHVWMCVSSAHGTAFQYRSETGGSSATSPPTEAGGVPRWLRLTRSGNTFTGYESIDGVNWTTAGTLTLALPTTLHVGLAVTSHNDGVLCTASFADVSISSNTTPPPPPPPPPPGTWSFGDIGAVGFAGSNTSSGNTITIQASGEDIWGTADAFRFVYRSLAGDGLVEARIDSMQNTNGWAKAGVMIRDSLAANARNVFACVTPVHHGVVAQLRSDTGGQTTNAAGPLRNAPIWLRLRRTGSNITASWSADGIAWNTYASYNVTLNATAYFGFALTSHDNTQLNTAVFSDPFVQ